jgi:YhcH/YjgK/YiaL family protein
MIFDSIANFKIYQDIHPLFRLVAKFLDEHPLQAFPIGKQELGNGIYFIVSEDRTKERRKGFIECHQKYMDIQLIIRGSEKIGICHKNGCTVGSYDQEQDYQKLKGTVNWLILQPGYFMIFFPQDGHMPQIQTARKQELVRKIVFKVPIKVGQGK